MDSKNYQDHLNLLRGRSARPPFAHVVELIAGVPTRSRVVIPLYAKALSALAVCGLIGIATWMFADNFRSSNRPLVDGARQSTASHSQFARSSVSSNIPSAETHPENLIPTRERHTLAVSRSDEEQMPSVSVISIVSTNDKVEQSVVPAQKTDSSTIAILVCPAREQSVQLVTATPNTRPVSAIALPDSIIEEEHNFFSTIGGALAQQLCANALFRQFSFTDAFVGAGYMLSPSSSIRILAGEEVFAFSVTVNNITYHDTTFEHNGQSYANIIGEVHPSIAASVERTYWLGASCRYSLGDASSTIRPFGEVMVGGATYGLLSHQSIGVQFLTTNRFTVDAMLGCSELLPQNSSWLTKAGFSAAVTYRW